MDDERLSHFIYIKTQASINAADTKAQAALDKANTNRWIACVAASAISCCGYFLFTLCQSDIRDVRAEIKDTRSERKSRITVDECVKIKAAD